MSPTALAFTAVISLAIAIVFGMLPALQASRLELATAFKAGSRSATRHHESLVMQRTNEIGIRVAFGATAGNVLASVLGRGLVVIGTGIAIGLVASLSLTQLMKGALWASPPRIR